MSGQEVAPSTAGVSGGSDLEDCSSCGCCSAEECDVCATCLGCDCTSHICECPPEFRLNLTDLEVL